jgi:hypothetical protein
MLTMMKSFFAVLALTSVLAGAALAAECPICGGCCQKERCHNK